MINNETIIYKGKMTQNLTTLGNRMAFNNRKIIIAQSDIKGFESTIIKHFKQINQRFMYKIMNTKIIYKAAND